MRTEPFAWHAPTTHCCRVAAPMHRAAVVLRAERSRSWDRADVAPPGPGGASAGRGGRSKRGKQEPAATSSKKRERRMPRPKLADEPPLTLSRADFSRGSPPWHIARKCKLSDLELAGTPAAMAACGDRIVDVTLEADAAGRRSFFLRGHAEAIVTIRCARCNALFDRPTAADFSFWLNAAAAPGYCPVDPDEVPLRLDEKYADFSGVVSEALSLELPTRGICGSSSCVVALAEVQETTGDPVWSAKGDVEDGKGAGAGLGQFSALAGLKERLAQK